MTPHPVRLGPVRWAAYVLALLLASCATPPSSVQPDDAIAQQELSKRTAPGRSPFVEPPGVLNPDVTQATISATMCVPGWTATVRPSTSYTQGVKKLFLERAGIPATQAIVYELDHFVPLALGGHPRSLDNLWLQRWDGAWNAKGKDRLERRLQVMVCAGGITLHTAHQAMQGDWKAAYRKYIAPKAEALEMQMDEAEIVE